MSLDDFDELVAKAREEAADASLKVRTAVQIPCIAERRTADISIMA
jgi:hypothetical protein